MFSQEHREVEASGYGWHTEVAFGVLFFQAGSHGWAESPAHFQGLHHPYLAFILHGSTHRAPLPSPLEGIHGATVTFELPAITLQLSPGYLPTLEWLSEEVCFLDR